MPAFRYNAKDNWYKGNIHIHSTFSDGGKTPEELSQMYSEKGYDFLCLTDHWEASETRDKDKNNPLLYLAGIELDGTDDRGSYYHVVCLGTFSGITRELGLVPAIEKARSQNGIIILAHPHWTGNSQEDCLQHSFDGVEIFNYVTQWLNGKGDNGAYWSMMLKQSPSTLSFAVDDAHIKAEHPGWNGGWIMVNSPTLTQNAIIEAIKNGNYYSSCGPEIHSIELKDNIVTIKTSPVQFIRLVGPGPSGQRTGSFDNQLLTRASFEIPEGWPYAYLEIEDQHQRRAWTNTLFNSTG
jgi:PHP domain